MKLLKQKDGLITIENERNDQLRCPYQPKTPIQTDQGITFVEHFCNSNCAHFELYYQPEDPVIYTDPGDEQIKMQVQNHVTLHCCKRVIMIDAMKDQLLHMVPPGSNIKSIN